RGVFREAGRERGRALAAKEARPQAPGILLDALSPAVTADAVRYRHVALQLNPEGRTAELTIPGPAGAQPDTPEAIRAAGPDFWPLRTFREIDDALLRLRFHNDEIALVLLKTRGDLDAVRQID